jgi:hypothetical protein
MGNSYPVPPFNPIQANPYYNGHGSHGMGDGGTPVRMGMNLEAHGMNMSPDVRRSLRVNRSMTEEGYSLHHA